MLNDMQLPMNITDVFLDNGEWSGEAISTIINIILVTALVAITGWYAHQVGKQTKLVEADIKRKIILERIQDVINPFITKIDSELDSIKKVKSFYFSTEFVFGQKFNLFFNDEALYSSVFWDIMGKSPLSKPLLKHELRSNDTLSDKVNKLYTTIKEKLTSKLESDNFNEHLKDWISKFNQKNQDAFGTSDNTLYQLENLCKEYIICNWDLKNNLQAGSELKTDFLKEFKGELLKYRELPLMEELLNEIEDILNKFKKSDEKVLKQFKKIKEKYRKEQHLPEKEINPGIRQLGELMDRISKH